MTEQLVSSPPSPPAHVALPKYVIIALACLFVLCIVLSIQVLYVRTSLSKYSKDDYYKQLLVKNEYANTQNATSCSNFGIYGWQIDTVLARQLNTGVIHDYAITKIALPAYFYSVPTRKNTITIEYKSRRVYFMPLKSGSAATSRFLNDILGGRIDFVTWQTGLFRATHIPNFKDDLKEFFVAKGTFDNVQRALDNVTVIALIQIPDLAELAEEDYALSQALDAGAPNTTISSFIGASTVVFSPDNLPNALHVVGYKV